MANSFGCAALATTGNAPHRKKYYQVHMWA